MTIKAAADVKFIDDFDGLQAFCKRVEAHAWIAIDTEFLREKTYYSQLCLIQVATLDDIACIDPLTLNELEPLTELFTSPDLLKVLHSGGQDMETLSQTLGSMPTPIFDTQIGAALLDEGEQISYAALVKSMLDIELPKSQTRTNWARRPLSESQLSYAADDVRYLRDVYLKEVAALNALERLDWALDESAKLEQIGSTDTLGAGLLKKVKGQHMMSVMARAVIREIALWRENLAQEKNLPRKWVLPDQLLLDIGSHPVTEKKDLIEIPSITDKQIARYGDQLVGCVKSVYQHDESHWQSLLQRTQVNPAQQVEIKRLQKVVEIAANTHGIAQSLIASRKELERLVLDGAEIPLLSGWRAELVGPIEASAS